MALVEVKVPDIGDFKDVAVIELLVKPGDTIKPEQSLVTVESDKASMEIPSSTGGVVKEIKVKLGDKISEGSVLLSVESAGGAAAPAAAAKAAAPAPAPAAQASAPASSPAANTAPAGAIEVRVPDIGDFKDVAVIEVLVKPGDRIKAEQSLVTVESDKASMEIPSSAAGVVKEMRVKLGDKISEGSLLLVLEGESGAQAAPSPAPSPAAAGEGAPPAAASPSPAPAAEGRREGGPAAAGAPIDIVVPDIGDFAEVAVIELLVKPGDTVAAEQSLITVESDKASMEIPSSHAGVVKALKVAVGDKVSKGSPIATLEGTGAAAPAASPAAAPSPAAAAPSPASAAAAPAPERAPGDKPVPTAALPAHEPTAPQGALPHASPTIR